MNNQLERLRAHRVLEVMPVFGGVRFTDGCDLYFTEELTPDEVDQLADELRSIAATVRKEQDDAIKRL